MKRLTFDGLFCDIVKCDSTPGGAFCETGTCTIRRVWERLKEYEDTGLEPEQVMELKSFTQGGIHKVDDGWKHIQELLKAEQDGRLVVLAEPMRPLVWGDKEHDTILCPRCLCDLMGGFEYAPSCETEMFQCPHCGQPIKSDKAIDMEQSEAEEALKGGDGDGD